MTSWDGGSAENAGAVFGPYIMYIAAPAHPCAHGIPYILYIAAPAHPCARGIPYILYIKKAPEGAFQLRQCIHTIIIIYRSPGHQ